MGLYQTWTIGGSGATSSIRVNKMSEQEFVEMIQAGGYVKITSDITLTKPVQIRNSVTLDLNNHNIVMNTDGQDAIWVLTGGSLIIKGQGNVIGRYYSVYAGGNAKVVINSGNYSGIAAAIYAQSTAVVEIKGGTYKVFNDDPKYGSNYALNIKDNSSAKIQVTGGKFYDFNPANCISEGPNTNFVVEGYESIEIKPNVWEIKKAAQ